ncbi:hypothetical protein KIN20_023060 [Parelaphostrongylus tenuis]|uniref:Uncharacterized protein n=1 Tax=Parelaphostrongylus tenuis TaxID=148309 RepID=A0AAD5QSP9_PARTN|nr:hypothetical protein KIN20_023060 [Parelaphostrongylus tenuis]
MANWSRQMLQATPNVSTGREQRVAPVNLAREKRLPMDVNSVPLGLGLEEIIRLRTKAE